MADSGNHRSAPQRPTTQAGTRAVGSVESVLAEASKRRSQLCSSCPRPQLCGAAVVVLTRNITAQKLHEYRASARSHGIEVQDRGRSLCAQGLVRVAIAKIEGGDFWVAHDDPLNQASIHIRTGETVIKAATDMAAILSRNIVV